MYHEPYRHGHILTQTQTDDRYIHDNKTVLLRDTVHQTFRGESAAVSPGRRHTVMPKIENLIYIYPCFTSLIVERISETRNIRWRHRSDSI